MLLDASSEGLHQPLKGGLAVLGRSPVEPSAQ